MKTLILPQAFLVVALITSTTGTSKADTLVGYNFNGLTGSVTDYDQNGNVTGTGEVAGAEVYVAPNTNDGSDYNSALVTASDLTRGSNYGNQVQNSGPPSYNGYFSENSFGIQPVNNSYSTVVSAPAVPGPAGSIEAGNYIQFEVSGNGGSLSLSGIDFGGGSQGNVDGSHLGLAYSTDGINFSTAGIDGGNNGIPIADYVGGTGGSSDPYLADVDLSGISALQNVTGPVYIDLFLLGVGGYQTGNFTTDWNGTPADLDDVTLLGSFDAAPEPSAWALMLGGLGLLIFWQRRNARA